MNAQTIDGKCYARMLFGGAAMLAAHQEELNALNVFPVCDGDTGTNMLKTIEGGLARMENASPDIGTLSKIFSSGVLLAARGNSGVILSQIFAGIHEGLAGYDNVNALQLANAYKNGIVKSYAAVQNPTEGTILTVFRESTEYAAANITEKSSVDEFFKYHLEDARRSLVETKNLLPVLKEADVVDSGAAGYLYIAEGMYKALSGKEISYDYVSKKEKDAVNIDLFTRDSILEFGYCTECLLRLTTAKVADPDAFEIESILSVLKELKGESVVAYKQGDIVKVHVHTFSPGEVLMRMQEFGEFLTVKIENMSLGHSEDASKKKTPPKKYALVAVASGDGIKALFEQMGVDRIIDGGQTANPSIEDFLNAFDGCDAENILVFPNNKNILLAAKQAATLYEKSKVHVIESKNLMQGYSALSVITPGITDISALCRGAERAAGDVVDGEITRAVRNASIDGFDIKEGDYLAISKGKITAMGKTPEEALLLMLEKMDMDLAEIITLFVGKNVSPDQRVWLTEKLYEIYEDCEIVVYEGGQELYDYYLAVE